MAALDVAVIVVYFALIMGVGFAFRGQLSLKEFFLGDRNIPWWAAMFSGIATIVSGISYLGAPGLAFASDYKYHQIRLGLPLALAALCVIVIPILHRLNVYSIYEYLERRFDRRTRLVASASFVLLKCCYLAIVIYTPSLVLAQITGWPTLAIVLGTGMTTVLYTIYGGIKGVIWTDTLQLGILFAGIVVSVAIIVGALPGGMGQLWSSASAAGRLEAADFSLDPRVTYTFWGGLIGGAVMLIGQWGTDQSEIQRFLTTKTKTEANRALVVSMIAATLVGLALFFIGTALFAFYQAFPEKAGLQIETNRIFAKFIIEEMPGGMRGLLVAAVLAASMSTISGVLNSQATALLADFYPLFKKREATIGDARFATFLVGAATTILACFGDRFGNVLEAANRLVTLFGGSLAGVFLLGMGSSRASAAGAFWGLVVGVASAFAMTLGTRISFLWVGVLSALVVVAVAGVISRLGPRSGRTYPGLTYKDAVAAAPGESSHEPEGVRP